jgi:membrane protein required for colicin V production
VNWNWLDYLLAAVVAASAVAGFAKGFARTGIALAAAASGLICGIWFYGTAGASLRPYVSSPAIANFIGFWIVFGSCVLAGALLGRLLAALLEWAGFSWLDRMLGAAFGVLRALVIAVAIVLLLLAFPLEPPPRAVVESRWAPYLVGAARACASLAPRELHDAFQSSYEKVREAWRQALTGPEPLPKTEI